MTAPSHPGGGGTGRCVLAIDLGSGGPKAGVVSESGAILAEAFRPVPLEMVPGGGVEQDPDRWWEAAAEASRAAIAESGVEAQSIAGVGCTSQWSVTVAVDDRCRPLMRAIHWLDGRGAPYTQALVRGFPSIQGYGLRRTLKWLRLTGLAPTQSGVDALGHILFIRHERPDIYREAHKFLEPVDFLTFRLTGRCTATQHSMVPALLVDNRSWSSTDYAEPLLRLTGVAREKLPDLLPNDAVVGPVDPGVAAEFGLAPGTRVVAGANDTSCSAIGAGAVDHFAGVVYVGTSQVLTCHLPHKRTDPLHMIATMPSPLPGKHLLLAEQGAGGKCLEFFLKRLVYAEDDFLLEEAERAKQGTAFEPPGTFPGDAYQRFDRAAARSGPGAGGVLFLPWLTGALAPAEGSSARGAFFNVSLDTGRHHLARAILEGLVFNTRWTLEAAAAIVKQPFGRIRLAGGGARCRTWAQIHADILGVPIQVVADPTGVTLRGAAFLALDRLGIRAIDDSAATVEYERVVEPIPEHQRRYDRLYRHWRLLGKRTRPVFQALNG